MENSRLLDFYLGIGTDHRGRYIQDIWNFDLETLEKEHDYIQWLFPLKEGSKYNKNAPLLTDAIIETFKSNMIIKGYLLESFRIMLRFYGFELVSTMDGTIVAKSSDFNERKQVWLSRCNHNYLRITRILKSLTILGLSHFSIRFYLVLLEIYSSKDGRKINKKALKHWTDALIAS